MKILYVITKSNWGGAQKHVFDLAVSMKARGHDVWVALGGEGLLKQRLEQAGIYTFSIASMKRDIHPGKDAGSFREVLNIIRDKRPDVLHLHSPKAAGLGSLAGRLMRVKKIVTTVHGFSFNENRPLHQKAAIMFFSWLTMILSHETILISEKEYSQALMFPWTKRKIRIIHLGIKPPTFISIEGAKREISKLTGIADFSKKIAICTIAELHQNKGLTYLINAMHFVREKYPNALCMIIGEGQERGSLSALIKEKNLSENVALPGYIDHASEYLKAFTLFALSSIKEGLPYVILEAGSASLPVVATTVGGIPEAVEDMKSGILVQPKNARELAHAICFMIEHPEERRKSGAALREKVVSEFSIAKMIESVESLYRESPASEASHPKKPEIESAQNKKEAASPKAPAIPDHKEDSEAEPSTETIQTDSLLAGPTGQTATN